MQIIGNVKHEHFESDSEDQMMESDYEMVSHDFENKSYQNSELAPNTFSL